MDWFESEVECKSRLWRRLARVGKTESDCKVLTRRERKPGDSRVYVGLIGCNPCNPCNPGISCVKFSLRKSCLKSCLKVRLKSCLSTRTEPIYAVLNTILDPSTV